MPRRRHTAYQGQLTPFAQPPGWVWPAAAAGLWLAAALLALMLAATGPLAGVLGPGWAAAGRGLWAAAGAVSWLLVALLVLAGGFLWRQRQAERLLWLAAGGLWLCAGSGALLGFTSLTLGGLPAGGRAGPVLAQSLRQAAGAPGAWLIPAAVAGAGLAAVVWALWPFLRQIPDILNLPGLSGGPEERPEAGPEPSGPAEPAAAAAEEAARPAPLEGPTGAEAPPEPEARYQPAAGEGPLIKPRVEAPAPAKPQQDKLAFAGGRYRLPPVELLQKPPERTGGEQAECLRHNSRLVEKKLADFGVQGQVREVAPGPVVTMYEFAPAPGVKISKVAGLADDLAMNLRATSIRIVAPIPGKAGIGIEIPNQTRETVYLREVLAAPAFQEAASPLTIAVGKDILGLPVVETLSRMPHLLIAGATGSGKSVFINGLVLSILYKASPEQVRLLMVDPKRIELAAYQDIPHLLYPLITSPQEATAGLRWAVAEMERRYEWLARLGVRNIKSYNQRLAKEGQPPAAEGQDPLPDHLPYVVIIIDELSDLMMASSKEVEALITRLAQMARAAGIHLVLATQRPSVDVITGLIKANFPARISFKVTSRVDSRTILDQQGAEHLLGQGDMLFSQPGAAGVVRRHAAFVTDREIEQVVEFIKAQAEPEYDESIVQEGSGEDGEGFGPEGAEVDERYADAVALVKETGQASISYVQRRLRVGYNRAARMIEQMEIDGIVGPSDGSKPREVLVRE